MSKVAVILSGSGHLDGAEIRESVATLWALSLHPELQVECFAPNLAQYHVIDHLTGKEMPGERRNVLIESARIARGAVRDLAELDPDDFDALLMPGGYGVAKNLSDFALKGASGSANPDLVRILGSMRAQEKPIGAACIAPAALALSIGEPVNMTVGAACDASIEIEKLGHAHFEKGPDEILVDEKLRIVTTPAYMFDDAPIDRVFVGIKAMVDRVVAMIGEPVPSN